MNRPVITRRRLIQLTCVCSTLGWAVGCAASAPPPASPAATAPTAASTAPKPAAPTAATPAPAKAPTVAPAAPAKRQFTPATVKPNVIGVAITKVMYLLPVQQGYFKEFALDQQVEFVPGDDKSIAAVVSGQNDLGISAGVGGVLAAIASGGDLKLVGSSIAKPFYDIYSKKDITSPKQLEGKSVGISAPGAVLHLVGLALFDKLGVDSSKVQFVNIGVSPDVYKAVAAGKVDAGVSINGFEGQARSDGVNVLVQAYKILPEYISAGIFTSSRMIAEKRDIIVRALAAYEKGFRFARTPDSKAEWVKIATSSEVAQPVGQAEFEWQWQREAEALRPDLGLTPAEVEYMQKLNLLVGNQKETLPFDKVADMSLAKDAAALLGS